MEIDVVKGVSENYGIVCSVSHPPWWGCQLNMVGRMENQ